MPRARVDGSSFGEGAAAFIDVSRARVELLIEIVSAAGCWDTNVSWDRSIWIVVCTYVCTSIDTGIEYLRTYVQFERLALRAIHCCRGPLVYMSMDSNKALFRYSGRGGGLTSEASTPALLPP